MLLRAALALADVPSLEFEQAKFPNEPGRRVMRVAAVGGSEPIGRAVTDR